jgi:hypothetical protein
MKRLRRAAIVCGLFVGAASLGLGAACQNEVRNGGLEGPAPVITAISPVSAVTTPERVDGGGDLIACCTFTVSVTYNLEARDFVRHAYVTWDDPRVRAARFEVVVPEDPDPGPDGGNVDGGAKTVGRTTALAIDLPSQIAAKGVRYGYSITLVTGQGAVSAPARGSVTVQ